MKKVYNDSGLKRSFFLTISFVMIFSGFVCAEDNLSALVDTTSQDMIEISVEVTEINNDKASELGIKWFDTIQTGEISYTLGGRTPESLPEIPSIIKGGDWARYSAFTAELKMLQTKGAAQILSKPKLVTKSGTSAKFHIGGTFPIVASAVTGGGTVEWKEYGIKTEVLPRVLKDRSIDLTLTTEVSRLDWANKVEEYPAVLTRLASSSVRVKSGHTIALAGMMETKKEEATTGIPLLSEIPVAGALFSRKSLVERKTTVLIFVTPKIIE
ncbi:MAG: putative type II secretion system protein D precursor [Elusimicrobia bacterium ADurb.Bin231]|nr:MAG: putative type II secretion system protein D precursor [Elusimicrobia bacterium ADurb.Bin231]